MQVLLYSRDIGQRLKKYILDNNEPDQLIQRITRFNTYCLVFISRDPKEYMSCHRSRARIFILRLIRIITLILSIKYILCAYIKKVGRVKYSKIYYIFFYFSNGFVT